MPFIRHKLKIVWVSLMLLISMLTGNYTNVFASNNVTYESLNPSILPGCVYLGQTKVPIYNLVIYDVSSSVLKLTSISFTTNAGYAAGDIIRFQIWYDSSYVDTLNGARLLCNITTSLGPGLHNTGPISVNLPSGTNNYYFFITADISSSATVNNTITVAALASGNFTWSVAPTTSCGDCDYAGGTQTIKSGSPYTSYASLPYSTSFETAWTNDPCSTSSTDLPDAHWYSNTNVTNSTGGDLNNIWHRSDYNWSDWCSGQGTYSQTHEDGSYSAEFNMYCAPDYSQGALDLAVNLSLGGGSQTFSFYYFNQSTAGGGLTVMLSTDGGITFGTKLFKLTTASTWTKESTTLTSTSATCVIRFLATSDWGNYNLGIDNLSIKSNNLPIELLSFTAKCDNAKADINWSTASETNNAYFTIERSKDGVIWEIITTILGAGNSNTILSYSYSDNNPYAGISYYRLKQTDFNGASVTYNPIATLCSDAETTLEIYPNPAVNNITIDAGNFHNTDLDLQIYDTIGKLVLEKNFSGKTCLDVSSFSNGIYAVEVKSQKGVSVKKFVKKQ